MNKTVDQKKVEMNGHALVGEVVSTKNVKTVIVQVEHTHRHPLYKKSMRKTKKYAAHNELEGLVVGDRVMIVEVKPVSKTKHFAVKEKVIA